MSENKITVVLMTNLFPNKQNPLRGIFVGELAERLKEEINLLVVSPLPWFPKNKLFKKFSFYNEFSLVPKEFVWKDIKVYSPKYLALPKLGWVHSFFYFISVFMLAARLIRKEKVDVINAHWLFPDGVAAAAISQILKTPLVLNAHGCDINLYSKFFLRRFQIKKAVKTAAALFVVSQAQKERLKEMKLDTSKVTVSANGVDERLFNVKSKIECREKLGLDSGIKTVLFVGQIIEVKGVNYLIEAVKLLKSKYKEPFKVFLIGEGGLRAGFETQIRDLGLAENMIFLGTKSREEISKWFGACDFLCLPSIREGCPCVVLEALASGRAVVASRVGGIPEVINDKNGILVDSGNSKDLALALNEALDKPWDENEIAGSVVDYTWSNVAHRYIEKFKQVITPEKQETK